MTDRDTIPPRDATDPAAAALARLRRPLRLTRLGMGAERVVQAFWPAWSLLIFAAAVLAFGVQDMVPIEVAWFGLVLGGLGFLWALVAGIRRFRWPSPAEALDRLDRTMPGRPISALGDSQAIGAADAASVAVWRAHVARMAQRAAVARPVEPDLRIARRDPYALRYVALTALLMALTFGSLWRVASVAEIATGGGAAAAATGPSWEGWITPPAYTGKPALYLNDIAEGTLAVPAGSRVSLRLYGEVGALTLAETVSARTELTSATDPQQDFDIVQPGRIAVEGAGGRAWDVTLAPDAAPVVAFGGSIGHEADGQMKQPFTAKDDYGIVKGRAEITLDVAALDRRFGLAADPEPREALVLDLPMPISGSRAEFAETLIDNLSQHPWANLPVKMTLVAEDASGQAGRSETRALILPGRRFFEPFAASLIEMRRDLLWTAANAPRVSQILRAVTFEPEGFIRNERAYLLLRVVKLRLSAGIAEGRALDPAARDEVAAALWDIAVMVEEGDLADALKRLQRAQDRLSEAIRNGANDEEIASLMQEMQQAMQDYIRKLAENAERSPDDQTADGQQSREVTPDQLQQMLDKLQQLMQEGKQAEAAQLLQQLQQLMENLQVTQGQSGQGEQSMQGLADTLRKQQGLSDEAFNDLQNQFGEQGQDGQQGQQGQDGQQGQGQMPGMGEGQSGQGRGQQGQQQGQGSGQQGQQGPGGADGQMGLADRQQALRRELDRQSRGALPGQGTAEGRAARDALDRAGRAMDGAEQALRDQDTSRALDQQADAMEALREGLRNLGDAMAQEQQRQGGQQGEAYGRADPQGSRDPLGRQSGQQGRIGTDEQLLQGEDVYRRAREILDELRRRSSDQTRPDLEREYLRRLLDRF